MLPKSLEAFLRPMLAMAGAQFPRDCGSRRRTYADFAEFVRETKPIGAPTLGIGAALDPIGMVSWTNCACGSTLVLFCSDTEGELHSLFMLALEAEAQASGRTLIEVALAVRTEVRRRAVRTRP